MILLLLFGLVAGFATCLTPCVLPVLPAVLSGGTTGGRRRPLGIVTGLVLARRMRVFLAGHPIPDRLAGKDVHQGSARVGAQRLYWLVDLPRVEHHVLTLAPRA